MQDGFVPVNFVPTHVVTWGGWLDDPSRNTWKDIVIVFPGNPGVTAYYIDFLDALYKELKIPIWLIGHAGHEVLLKNKGTSMPELHSNPHLYDLNGQIEHKRAFLQLFVPKNANIQFVSHSIGSKMVLELLKDKEIAAKVTKSYLLFPAIERMAETTNGKFFLKYAKPCVGFLCFMAWIYTLLPPILGTLLILIYFKLTRKETTPSVVDATSQLIHPLILRCVFYLAIDEMKVVKELDRGIIDEYKDKLVIYYGATDNWAPKGACDDLKKVVPGVNAIVCNKGMEHAFMVYHHPEVMSQILLDLMKDQSPK